MDEYDIESIDVNDTAVLASQMVFDLLHGAYISRNTYDINQTKFKRMIRSIRNALIYREEYGYQIKYCQKTRTYYLYKTNVYEVRKNL